MFRHYRRTLIFNSHRGEEAALFVDGLRRFGKEAHEELQRWLMLVTNTIQNGHLRDVRNPIRGFDLHKPTLYRVTRGHHSHLSGAIKMAGGGRRREVGKGEDLRDVRLSCQAMKAAAICRRCSSSTFSSGLIVHFVVGVFFYRYSFGICFESLERVGNCRTQVKKNEES